MRSRLMLFLFLAALWVALTPLEPVLAARGTPGSAEFGYGAHLDLNGQYALEAVHLASDLQLDWMGLDLSWRSVAPKAGSVDWSRLDPILDAAARSQLSVMVSLTDAPEWALTAQGPAADQTSQFIIQLVKRYPQPVQAIELFPGSNTLQGWGRDPDAQAYMKVLNAVKNALKRSNPAVRLVGAGLKPIPSGEISNAQEIDDAAFLQSLYKNGFGNAVSIVSLQASDLTGEPLQAADKSENHVLRHYENIRQVMLNNGHESGMIWITHLTPPRGTLNAEDQKYQNPDTQSAWFSQAFSQLKSQLYIGVAFLSGLNPAGSGQSVSLIQSQGDYHPFYRSLRELISVNRSDPSSNRPGRAKDQPLLKSVK
jgi:hypothetical protein